jgi:hypothetical protein
MERMEHVRGAWIDGDLAMPTDRPRSLGRERRRRLATGDGRKGGVDMVRIPSGGLEK